MKRIYRPVLFLLILLTVVPLTGFVGLELVPKAQAYDVGDTILFGTYPQTRVDETPELKAAAEGATWKSYGYYIGTGNLDGKMKPGNFMQFADFFIDHEKYRAVTFSVFRPYETSFYQPSAPYTSPDPNSFTYQDDNGYTQNHIYYFKYEPLIWRILDPSTGYIMCESIIDSQAYQNTVYRDNYYGRYYQGIDSTVLATDYATSSIRDWLNYDFYETAFTEQQKETIETPTVPLDNSSTAGGSYDSSGTYDKIYLISYADATNPAYGFDETAANEDVNRLAKGTDYAQCQGLKVYRSDESPYLGSSQWMLRTSNVNNILNITYDGSYIGNACYSTHIGVRPACCISNLQDDVTQSEALFSLTPGETIVENETPEKDYETILFGTYPQTRVEETPELKAAAEASTWKSYGYYKGTGSKDGKMQPNDFMQFTDFFVGNEKFRAVTFSAYRPYETSLPFNSSSRPSYQEENGYTRNHVYYFKYEPLEWRILDSTTGYIMCESIIDAQAYQNTVYSYPLNIKYWQGIDSTVYASDYATSSIRTWLNYDFYETAFTQQQKNNIETPTAPLNNDSNPPGEYNSAGTYDKIYLISSADTTRSEYGFNKNEKRRAQGTDYAKCQGLSVTLSWSISPYIGNSYWWTRTPRLSGQSDYIMDSGSSSFLNVYNTSNGVRPACCISNLQDDTAQSEALFSAGVHNHTPGDAVIENERAATCATAGSFDEVVYCTECGAELSRNIKTVEKLAHTVRFVNVAKTAEDSYIGEATCTACGGTAKIGDIIPAAGTDRFQSWDESKSAITAMCFNGDFGTVSSGAFSDFPNLGYVIFNAPSVTLAANAFSNCPELEAVLFFGDAAIDTAALDTDASTVQIYRPQSAAFSFTPSDGKYHTIPFSFAAGVLHLNGSVTWDGYQFLDTMTAFCLQFDPIDVVTCTDFTFDGLTLYAVQASGKKTRIKDNRLENAELRAAIGDQEETVLTFNALVRGIADGSITDFRMLAKDEDHEEIKDTPVVIEPEPENADDEENVGSWVGSIIHKAIKWVVRLMDTILKVLKVFGKK